MVADATARVVRCQRLDDERDMVTISNPQGDIELSIVLTEAGPVLRVAAAELELTARDEARIKCAELVVEATRGDIRLEANDFVALRGERIKLNC